LAKLDLPILPEKGTAEYAEFVAGVNQSGHKWVLLLSEDDRPFRPMYVQVGAFSDRNNANRLAEQLKDGGFDRSFVLTTGQGRERMHRVRIGPIQSGDFDRIQNDLRAVGIQESRLVQDN